MIGAITVSAALVLPITGAGVRWRNINWKAWDRGDPAALIPPGQAPPTEYKVLFDKNTADQKAYDTAWSRSCVCRRACRAS